MTNFPTYYTMLQADVRYDNRLTFFARILYSELELLSRKNGYAHISYNTLSELFRVSKRYVIKQVKELERYGLIRIERSRSERVNEVNRIYVLGGDNSSLGSEQFTTVGSEQSRKKVGTIVHPNNTRGLIQDNNKVSSISEDDSFREF